MRKLGHIITNDVRLEKHEYDTVMFLYERGYRIELIPPSYTKGQHTADMIIDGVEWELKCPQNNTSSRAMEYLFRKASRQSSNVILDIRKSKMAAEECIRLARKQFEYRRNIKRLKIITKDGKLLDFCK